MLAVAPFDWQLTDTYFVVAHFHYVLIGAIVFMIFAAIYYWFPKATGRMLSETLGKWHFWLFLIGFHLTFDTLHFAGLKGMPRRIYTYQPGRGLDTLNLIASIGALVQGIAVLIFYQRVQSLVRRSSRRRPLGRMDAGMVHDLTAARYNFAAAGCSQPPPSMGSETPGRPRLEVRMKGGIFRDGRSTNTIAAPPRPAWGTHAAGKGKSASSP